MNPIDAGYYTMADILEGGNVHIEHISECLDAMAIKAENRRRLQDYEDSRR